jgi:leucyl-tRNA synthetase
LIGEDRVTLIIQINGKMRDKLEIPAGLTQKEAEGLTLSQKKVKNLILGREIKKIIFVPGKLINIVI